MDPAPNLLDPTASQGQHPSHAPAADSTTDTPRPPSFLALGSVLWVPQPGDGPSDPPPPQIYIGCGRYPTRHPGEAELVYEFRLVGIGGATRECMDSTSIFQLTFPDSVEMVVWGHRRWDGWVQTFHTGDETLLPALLPYQRRALLTIAQFLRALCRRGADGIDLAEWPLFWAVLMDGFPHPRS
uniref:C6 zinc finger domain-containing protein n=1 Tax=Ganoderma boninense TaxID=34458 RepID=A0A5K1K0E4_9APHY|nr:C6 zinc finger domain-containing protein [Ganoderma boninense]